MTAGTSFAAMTKMGPSTSGRDQLPSKRRSSRGMTAIHALDHDIFCMIFSLLDFFDIVRCSTVCKSWNAIIDKSKLLEILYYKQNGDVRGFNSSTCLDNSLKVHLEELAMDHHRSSLQESPIHIDQWKAHSVGVTQCRMKMGLIATGAGDKDQSSGTRIGNAREHEGLYYFDEDTDEIKQVHNVVRLWSLESYKCLEEYTVPHMASLVDFDFDESKIVGLVGTRLCIWSRNGKRSIFPSTEGTFPKGLCMRYIDPESVVGCEDGTARVFDMYSRKCSQIIRMHAGPVTCLSVTDNHLILSASSLGSITMSSLSGDQRVATLRSRCCEDIRTMCFNPRSHLMFAGSTTGYASCWDIRKMKMIWQKKVSPNVLYSMQHLRNDTSRLVVGGIDGVLRVLDQDTGEVLSNCVMESRRLPSSSRDMQGFIERKGGRRVANDTRLDRILRIDRPPITCLAVGMKKVVTTHNNKYIRVWKFN